jgi:hypothetical protein
MLNMQGKERKSFFFRVSFDSSFVSPYVLEKPKTPPVEYIRWVKSCGVSLELKLLWLLPGEALVGEVPVLRGLEVDGLGEVELLDNDTGSHVEVVADDLDKLVGGLARGAIRLNEQ